MIKVFNGFNYFDNSDPDSIIDEDDAFKFRHLFHVVDESKAVPGSIETEANSY